MPWELLNIQSALPVFALVVGRLGGLMLAAPIFASRTIPRRVKVGLTFATAWVLYPVIAPTAPASIPLSGVVVGMFNELLVGVTIGLVLATLVSGVQIGGLIVGRQAGMGIGQSFDPATDTSSSTVAQLYTTIILTLFVMIGGLRATMAALLDTFEVIPLMSYEVNESLVFLLTQTIASAFVLAIRLAAPALIALSLVTLAMGLLTRTMPQMNILSVGFSVRAMVMMGTAGLAISVSQEVVLDLIMDGLDTVRDQMGVP